jgi:tRNA U34 5-methylaminomethyl-2-thiouridine-forming methyltransferase MnmC
MTPLRRILTEDGSYTLLREDLGETYHSAKGSITESTHVYIRNGLQHVAQHRDHLTIAEIGFGTGLNALLTALEKPFALTVNYYGLDTLPLSEEVLLDMRHAELIRHPDADQVFRSIAAQPWQSGTEKSSASVYNGFHLAKLAVSVQNMQLPVQADLVYFDAFAPRHQPEMWEPAVFELLATQMAEGGVLVTYCAQGKLRRSLQAMGWEVERVPVAGGLKNEMIRARRPAKA